MRSRSVPRVSARGAWGARGRGMEPHSLLHRGLWEWGQPDSPESRIGASGPHWPLRLWGPALSACREERTVVGGTVGGKAEGLPPVASVCLLVICGAGVWRRCPGAFAGLKWRQGRAGLCVSGRAELLGSGGHHGSPTAERGRGRRAPCPAPASPGGSSTVPCDLKAWRELGWVPTAPATVSCVSWAHFRSDVSSAAVLGPPGHSERSGRGLQLGALRLLGFLEVQRLVFLGWDGWDGFINETLLW